MLNRIEIQNVKKLKFVRIEKDRLGAPVVVLEGKNAQGKTSIIDALAMAICGDRSLPENPIREGETFATIELKTTDDYKIERRIGYVGRGKNKGELKSELKVWDKTGSIVECPQTFLNELLGKAIIRPLEIVHSKGKERMTTVKEALAIDFSHLDAEIGRLKEERLQLGREVSRTEGHLEAYKEIDDSLPVMRSADDVLKEISAIDQLLQDERNAAEKGRRQIEAVNQKRAFLVTTRSRKAEKEKKINDNMNKIAEHKAAIASLKDNNINLGNAAAENDKYAEELEHQIKEMESKLEEGFTVPQEKIDEHTELKKELEKIHGKNELSEKIRKRDLLKHQLKKAKDDRAGCTGKIDGILEQKREILRKAAFPVKGMSFGEDDITFNEMPFSQCSMSEKIKMSIAINALINPKMRIMVLEDGSSLDDASMNELESIARKYNYQIFVEKVKQSSRPHCLVIEEGVIKQ